MLRQLRTEARLTQEELAEQAGLSPRSVSDLERGINRTARKDSALMLASALKLTGPVQEAFVAAARGRAEPAQVLAARSEDPPESSAAAATRTLPRDIGGFTGREVVDIPGLSGDLKPRQQMGAIVHRPDGSTFNLPLYLMIMTADEVAYFKNGGILPYVLRNLLAA